MQPDAVVIDAVVIGRNEGQRLRIALASLRAGGGRVRRVIYVDSGSTDGSQALAAAMGAEVVALDLTRPFTAARARNAGLAALAADPPDFVQLMDGDCELDPGWIAAALQGFAAHSGAVVICGRRRERYPAASVYNRLCDREWNTPVGEALACGGDALMRWQALQAVGFYREDLIAGEEPELCQRLRRKGGQIWRIDAEMTLHDAAMTRFPQWWRRTKRAGYAFAEGAALHGAGPDRHWRREARRALIWGAGLPLSVVALALIHPAFLLLALAWPLQVARLAWRLRHEGRAGREAAFFTVLGKFPEAIGAIGFYLDRLRGRKRGLIEYK
ncbi:glycosyltransferase family 2 protein [Xinfangfangia sp. D13-10-4-6]|uniref:glycosyltransferase family 2 protein n=1 Tax=Pseudogemmobacter hezensis TaxID=2737662 RepID=UPI001554394B|nr:glycosyltransferase family A protein [Pseudogemmobacter hezensis]NPD13870.1 glycosyltransferase family 2 protein [Pseudogemmobacter hezensis]